MARNDRDNKPRLIAFEVTRRCRYNCRHCRADADAERAAEELTTEQCKRIIGAVANYAKCVLILTGGEPTERSDIHDFVRCGTDAGLRVVMATCGYSLDDASVAALKEAGVTALSLSLDGATAQTHDAFRRTPGAFDAVISATQAAHRANLRFQINTTITRSNLSEVPAIADLAYRLGAYCFNPFILVPTGRGEEIAEEILRPQQYAELLADLLQMKTDLPIELRVTCGPQYARLHHETGPKGSGTPVSGCMGGRGFGFISCRGDVQTCGFLDLSAGNLVENGYDFAAIWEGVNDDSPLRKVRDLQAYNGKCGRCAYVKLCGGCRARAYALTGDVLGEDPICWYESGSPDCGLAPLAEDNSNPKSEIRNPKSPPLGLTDLQKRLCNRLQKGLPIDAQPFVRIADEIGCTEEQVIEAARCLQETGVIRRIGAIVNHRVLGMHSTLVTAHVPEDVLSDVTEAVNQIEGVSHSYLRRHRFNLWFTLQDRTPQGIDATLANLHTRFAIDFRSLPVVNMFKLDVYFDAFGVDCGLRIADCGLAPPVEVCSNPKSEIRNPKSDLTADHKHLLSQLQGGLKIVSRPFDDLMHATGAKDISPLQELVDLGVIRRIAAVVDHRKLGYVTNILFVAQVPPERIGEAGRRLAQFRAVSHCYERRTFEGWPYNFYAMLHGRTTAQVQQTVDRFIGAGDVTAYELLPTEVELKKHPVRLSFAFDS
jgi:radical SAM protein with 4Fe4S-binding SPASM domain